MANLTDQAGAQLTDQAGAQLTDEAGATGISGAASLNGQGTLGASPTLIVPPFTSVGTAFSATAKTFTLTPSAIGDFILLQVISETSGDHATAVASSNVAWDSSPLVTPTVIGTLACTVFKGQVTSTSSATATVTISAGSPTLRIMGKEFACASGYSTVALDASATANGTAGFASITPAHGSGELYWSFAFDSGTGTAGTTAGYSYAADANGNLSAWNVNCGAGAQAPNAGGGGTLTGIAVMLFANVPFSGGAGLAGQGALGGAGALGGTAGLAGEGALGGTGEAFVPGTAALFGQGTMSPAGEVISTGVGLASLNGEGTLGGSRTVAWAGGASLNGEGALGGTGTGIIQQTAGLSGEGSLGITLRLGLSVGLAGAGTLSIPQVSGGLVNGVGGAATPQALPGSSQVAVAPPGSGNWQWLGTLGQVTALTYSFICPGGCDKMSMTIMCPASFRTQLFSPGWQVKIVRGGHQVWDGKLDEPQPSASGWTLTAVGTGNRGADFTAYYSIDDVWPVDEPDEVINRAIGRGLPWVNPGYNGSSVASQFWMGQATDPGSQTVTAFLNLICTRGGLTWYVNSQPGGSYGGDDLQIFPLPTTPNRLLVCTTPVARTLGGDLNVIVARYMSVADDNTASPPVPASYNVLAVQNAASVAVHQPIETYIDLSDAGVLTVSQVQSVCSNIFQLYQRASWAGPFQASYGQLLNTGGAPVDPGTDQAGTVVRMILTDYGLGGEVQPGPIDVLVGSYSWDDFRQIATISPMQTLDMSLTGLLSAWNTTNSAVNVAST